MMMIFSLSYPRMITSYSHSSVESTHIANLKQSFILPCSSGASQAFYNVYLSRRNKLNFAYRENSTRTKKILGKEKKVIWLFAISTIDCRCCCRVEYNIVVFEHVFWFSRRERERKQKTLNIFSLIHVIFRTAADSPHRRSEENQKSKTSSKRPESERVKYAVFHSNTNKREREISSKHHVLVFMPWATYMSAWNTFTIIRIENCI